MVKRGLERIKMSVVYEPRGAAAEYSPLAVNLYTGCAFACKYCYVPAIRRQTLHAWSANPVPRSKILKKLEADCKKIAGDKRCILLCFMSDPYQSPEASILTREALLILEKYDMKVTVLTKAGVMAAQDFGILRRNNWSFGTTLSYTSNHLKALWEPGAASPTSRCETIMAAHALGIRTWVSVEPVMDTNEALGLIRMMSPYVDHWKIGKMNHRKLDIDWKKFHKNAVSLLNRLGADYYIKKELREAAGITK
jgi:DNA repair photolyase